MRKIIFFRGAPGSGKSTLIRQLGLENHHLSMDALRQVLAGPELTPDGQWAIAQAQNDRVAQQFKMIYEERLGRGETLALEATFLEHDWLKSLVELAKRERYETAVIDLSQIPEDVVRQQNLSRDPLKQLSEAVMNRWVTGFKARTVFPEAIADRVFVWDEHQNYVAQAQEFLKVPVLDVSAFDQVLFIGDIQGCLDPLLSAGSPFEQGFQENTLYVFTGDLLDRGPQNGQVMRWFVDEVIPRQNQCVLIWGNHEDHIHRWSIDAPPVSREFKLRTLPQLIEAGLTTKDADAVCRMAQDALLLKWRDQKIMVTHAGLPTVPDQLHLVARHQLTHGTGSWNDPVDQQFERLAPSDWVQVHGHRNHGNQPILASKNSINLEDAVDKGGALRMVVLNENGWQGNALRNDHYVGPRERLESRMPDWKASWLNEERNTVMPPELLETMRNHEGVKQSVSKSMPEIASLNFARDVFQKSTWDEITIKARGLFFHQPTGEIVARGYNKFFNLGEKPETELKSLRENLAFPITLYLKENGYLGNLGLHPETQDLVFASKSTPDGDFAQWFREIAEQTWTSVQFEKIRRFMRDQECSMVFEVIDPVRDPHMVKYEQPQLVLLDIFHRSISGQKLPYEDLKNQAAKLGLKAKERAFSFKHMDAFEGWLKKCEGDLTYRYNHQDIEGFVIEDQEGFQTKIKMGSYAFWKSMRGGKDRALRLLTERDELLAKARPGKEDQRLGVVNAQIEKLTKHGKHPLAPHFMSWLLEQPREMLNKSIIDVRDAYVESGQTPAEYWTVPYHPYAQPQPKTKAPAQEISENRPVIARKSPGM